MLLDADEFDWATRRLVVLAKVRRRFRLRALARPSPGWWVIVTRGDDGWR